MQPASCWNYGTGRRWTFVFSQGMDVFATIVSVWPLVTHAATHAVDKAHTQSRKCHEGLDHSLLGLGMHFQWTHEANVQS